MGLTPFGLAFPEAWHGNYQKALEVARAAEQLLGDTRSGIFLGLLAYGYGLAIWKFSGI